MYLPPATKLGQGNIFTSVCQEFCSQGRVHGRGCACQGQVHGGGMRGGRQRCVWGRACMAGGSVWQEKLAIVAGSTHTTGKHSCLV